MNKEQLELLNDAYKNYCDNINLPPTKTLPLGTKVVPTLYTQQEFINKNKTDNEFSKTWGLKIEERELSLEERYNIALPIWKEQYGPLADMMVPTNVDNTPFKIPTKLITISYNDQTIESYG